MKNQNFIHFVSNLINMLIEAGAKTVKTKEDYTIMYNSFNVTLAYRRFNLYFLGSDTSGLKNGEECWPYVSVDINGVQYTFEPNGFVQQETIDNIALKIDRLADTLFLKPNKNEMILEATLEAISKHKKLLTRETYLIKNTLIALYKEHIFENAQYKIKNNRERGRMYTKLLKFKNLLPHSLKLRHHPFIQLRKLPGAYGYFEVTFNNGQIQETFLDNRNPYAAIRKAEFSLREILTNYGHDRYKVNVLKEYSNLFHLDVEVLKNLDTLSTM